MEIIFGDDQYRMNWLRQDFPYAEVRTPFGLASHVATTREGDVIRTKVTLSNNGDMPFFTSIGDIGITVPLNDHYTASDIAETKRCSVHINAAGSVSWILALRMGGEAPHLGLVFTTGSINSYSLQTPGDKRGSELSNDRGCFILHPDPLEIAPGERSTIEWTIFPVQSKEDFLAKAGQYARFIDAQWSQYVLYPGEASTLTICPSWKAQSVSVNGAELDVADDGSASLSVTAQGIGYHTFDIDADGRTLRTCLFVSADYYELAADRARFIMEKQQYRGSDAKLRGAYLPYDNEEERIAYSSRTQRDPDYRNDHGAGRERVGMGLFIAEYLLAVRDGVVAAPEGLVGELTASLKAYADFVSLELVNETTGEVWNDVEHSYVRRFYNNPWFIELYELLWEIFAEPRYLDAVVAMVRRYYQEYGFATYAIEMPMLQVMHALRAAGRDEDARSVGDLFIHHARELAAIGRDYPPSEVSFEQSIVAPAIKIMLDGYLISGDESMLSEAKAELPILDQFNGMQPDSHLNEVAIRHWDMYWFGKDRQLGDTFPHYWSALTGVVFDTLSLAESWLERRGAAIACRSKNIEVGDDAIGGKQLALLRRAEASVRAASLPLVTSGGRGSCAFLFPYSVNGVRGQRLDVLANDQDWGMYMLTRRMRGYPASELSESVEW